MSGPARDAARAHKNGEQRWVGPGYSWATSMVFIIHFRTRPERTESFAAGLPYVRKELAAVDGCIDVQVFRDEHEPDRFCLVERWESKAKHAAHMARVNESGRWQQVLEQLAEPPKSSYYAEIAATGS